MSTHIRSLATTFAILGAACAATLAPVAAARGPNCVNTGPNTTQCSTPGHTAIVTGPPPNTNPWNGWPGYGFGIGFGGFGIGW